MPVAKKLNLSSPYSRKAYAYVCENQGCCKRDVAAALATWCDPSKVYYLVNTQISLGNLVAHFKGGRYYLYTYDFIPEILTPSLVRRVSEPSPPYPIYRGLRYS